MKNSDVEVKGVVQVEMNFGSLTIDQAQTPAGKTALTNSVADAAYVTPSQVSIASISASAASLRMRMLSGQISIFFDILLADFSQAVSLENKLKSNLTAVASAVAVTLRAAHPAFAYVIVNVVQISSGITVVALSPPAKHSGHVNG
jgi:hypothetical protein